MRTKQSFDLVDLIPKYGLHKEELDDLKKLVDRENKDIKTIIKQRIENGDGSDVEVDGWVAKYIITTRESMDEERVLQILKNAGYTDAIKTREYVDFDVLESAIYKGDVPKEVLLEMDKAKTVKEIETLRVTRTKN